MHFKYSHCKGIAVIWKKSSIVYLYEAFHFLIENENGLLLLFSTIIVPNFLTFCLLASHWCHHQPITVLEQSETKEQTTIKFGFVLCTSTGICCGAAEVKTVFFSPHIMLSCFSCAFSQVAYFFPVNDIFLVVISPDCMSLSEFASLPSASHVSFWPLLCNMKSCQRWAKPGRGLCCWAGAISLLSSATVSVRRPHGAKARRLFPFHPACDTVRSHDISPKPGTQERGRRGS